MAKARTQTSALGSEAPRAQRGFTLIELMVVVTLIAIASAVASLALRDPATTQLEREGVRLAALLESARAEARAAGVAARWVPHPPNDSGAGGFTFVGLPDVLVPGDGWLDERVVAELRSDRGALNSIVLGPEPVIGAQTITLRLDGQRLTLATDGLGPFQIVDDTTESDGGSF